MSKGVVVLPQWKFMLLLIVGMLVPVCAAVALCGVVMFKHCGGDAFPMIVSDCFWICFWGFVSAMIVAIAFAILTK